MRNIIEKGTKIPLASFRDDPLIRANALHIMATTRSATRHDSRIFEDAINGLALEAACIKHLSAFPKLTIVKSEDMEYDFKILLEDEEYLVDVKGRFKENSKTYTQSAWERDRIKQRKILVSYLCFNCTDGVNAVYDGHALSVDFVQSIKYSGYYIYSNQLR